MRIAVLTTLVVMIARTPVLATIDDLEKFLRTVAETTEVTVPLRADGELDVVTPKSTRRLPAVLIVRPPADLYIELRQTATKAILLTTGQAYVVKKDVAKAEAFAQDASLADSDFAREDLEPFRLSHYTDWRISDESGGEVTVTLYPRASAYSLEVVTIDREKMVPVKILYYRERLNNLVKMRRDSDYVLIGRKWRPALITMENFTLRTHSTFTLHWTQNPTFPPELFDPIFLPRPSVIVWPAAAAQPAP
jgi:hypothetical protein